MALGFVGLGQMGLPMALNLSRAEQVLAYSRRKGMIAETNRISQQTELAALGGCHTVFLCLPSSTSVREVLFGPEGLASHLKAGAVVVDTGTSEYNATLEIAARLEDHGLRFVDAPVSGMQARAEDGTLTMMCGGPAELVEALRPLCSAVASKILHMGPVGSGQLTKLVNQLLFDINAAALAEILPLAARLGLDPAQMGEVVNSGTGRSYASEFFIPNILQGVFERGYPMEAAYKDLVSGAELSASEGVPLPVLAAATATYQRALLEGHGSKDKGGMILVFEKLLGVAFRTQEDAREAP